MSTGFVQQCSELRGDAWRLFLAFFRPQKLESEQFRNKLEASIQQHWLSHPLTVYELIHENWDPPTAIPPPQPTEFFVVFINRDLDVDWVHNGTLPDDAAERVSQAEAVAARRCEHLPKDQVLELKRLVGQAIVIAMQG